MKAQALLFVVTLCTAACTPKTSSTALAPHAPQTSPPSDGAAGEFGVADSGFVYPSTTMRQLRHIVDSLNYRFTTCDLTKQYQAVTQGRAHYIELNKGNLKQARQYLATNPDFEAFLRQYPQAETTKDLLVTRRHYGEAPGQAQAAEFESLPLKSGYGLKLRFDQNIADYMRPVRRRWVVRQHEKTEYSEASIEAFYFPEELRQPVVPLPYARLIQYSDCMVDTTARIYTEQAERTGVRYEPRKTTAIATFLRYAHSETSKPAETDSIRVYIAEMKKWEQRRFALLDAKAQTSNFRQLLASAVTEALNTGGSDDEFEEYVRRYHSPKVALQLKRNRIVVGGCSMDDSPRLHALNIAKLAAESVSWEVFLRAHLDIMNDRFERVSDGSYAWGRRKTYFKELEALDINAQDLMLGISLRIQNPSQNHYYGSIGRVGRALAETAAPDKLEARMRGMIADQALDDYNRTVIYYLYRNYVNNLPDNSRKATGEQQLQQAAQTLPTYLAAHIRAD